MYSNDYLKNPILPKDFYYVKCLAIETTGGTLMIRLQVVPYESYGEASNAVLHVTLRNSANAQGLRQKFFDTFRVGGDPAEAVGRFGCVLIDDAEFQGKQYSAVHFIRQSKIAQRQALVLERDDRNGVIPWVEADLQVL
jgi:hypothetical protein